jgi:hypothetical protein
MYQLLVDPLTWCLQRLPTKSRSKAHHRLVVLSSLSQTTKKVAPTPQFSQVQNQKKQTNKQTKIIQLPVTKSHQIPADNP